MRCLILVVALASACSQHNPDACCRTQDQCTQFGLDGITACDTGKVCNDSGACVASECTTSADCTDPSLPICENNLCVAKCTTDDECSTDAPHCSTSDGACVACLMDSDCDASVPVCDMTTHACRGCVADSECSSGACLAATNGACADSGNILWVTALGSDTGDCPKTAACKTITYAVSRVLTFRNVIHVDGVGVSTGPSTITLGGPLYIDGGSNATLTRPAMTVFNLSNQADLTLDGITVEQGQGEVVVMSAGTLRLRKSNLSLSKSASVGGTLNTVDMSGGALIVDSTTFDSASTGGPTAIGCSAGSVAVKNSIFRAFALAISHCDLTFQQSTMQINGGGNLAANNGKILIENSVFTSSSAVADAVFVNTAASGSQVRFNTWADTSTGTLSGAGLTCDASIDVSSNIFIWGPQALAETCTARYSIFDDATSEPPAAHNSIATGASLFVDFANSDFHLSATSPARGAADPAESIAVDRDGTQRPNPAGTTADIGAYEAP
ncbi:MAG: choice-of-anchor Q domain-containing protein [Kofleriaceae bacterium]